MGILGHPSLLISDYIIYQHGPKFTPFQLIKLVFMAHGRVLTMLDIPLIRDHVEAWDDGPVIPALHEELKEWDDRPVNLEHGSLVPDAEGKSGNDLEEMFLNLLGEDERDMIDMTIKQCGHYSDEDLLLACTEPGSPWDTYYDGKAGTRIPDSAIQEYYQKSLMEVLDSEDFDVFLKFAHDMSTDELEVVMLLHRQKEIHRDNITDEAIVSTVMAENTHLARSHVEKIWQDLKKLYKDCSLE